MVVMMMFLLWCCRDLRPLKRDSPQELAEGNSTLANRAAAEAKEARAQAGRRAEQAEAQVGYSSAEEEENKKGSWGRR